MKKKIYASLVFLAAAAAGLLAYFLLAGPVGGALPEDIRDYYCGDAGKPFFAETAPGSGKYRAARRLALEEEFQMPKPPGTKRVFVVGESVAAILGAGRYWSGKGAAGGGKVEVINCGMGGYDSAMLLRVLEEVLAYSPDLVVVMSGNNEVMPPTPCPGLGADLARRKRSLLEKRYSVTEGAAAARLTVSLREHGANLDSMAGAAKKAGVPLVLCTLPANVSDISSNQPLPLQNTFFASGYRHYYEGRQKEALANFQLAAQDLEAEPHSLFYSARALDKAGRSREAVERYFSAADADRAFVRRNGLIRGVAAARGLCVADLEKYFISLDKRGAPGFEHFTDWMHWRPKFNAAVRAEILAAAEACGGLPAGSGSGAVPEPPARTPEAQVRLNYALAWLKAPLLNEPALAQLSWLRKNEPALLARALSSPEELKKLLIGDSRSVGQAVNAGEIYPDLLAHAAELDRRAGNHAGALKALDQALRLKPLAPGFRLLRAQALHGTGKKREALDELTRLVDEPGVGGQARGLALAYGATALPKGVSRQAPAGPLPAPAPPPRQKTRDELLAESCFSRAADAPARELSLRSCQELISWTAMGGLGAKPGSAELKAEASFRSYQLLAELDRREEGEQLLHWAVLEAPKGWKNLEKANRALGKN